MRTTALALATVLTTATAAFAGGPRTLLESSALVTLGSVAALVLVNLALWRWKR